MYKQISMENLNEMIDAEAKLYSVSNNTYGFEKRCEFPEEIGKGLMRVFKLRPGLEITYLDFQPHENLSISSDVEYSLLSFAFFISGPGSLEWAATHGREKYNLNNLTGRSLICFYPKGQSVTRFSGEQRQNEIMIHISSSLLKTFMGDQLDQIPSDLCNITEGSNENSYYHYGMMIPSMQAAVHEILNCPYYGSIKRMYLESKAIELITHKLAQVVFAETGLKKSSVLHPEDIERIHHAGEIISHELENPPALFELARLVGLTHTKLNRGFREIYGTTVFGYLRKIRLEQAKLLLEEQRMNVTEAALTVGYNSLSSFTHAFSDYFGITPMMCIKRTL